MYRKIGWLIGCWFVCIWAIQAQSNHAVSIFEGEPVGAVAFRYQNQPADTALGAEWRLRVGNAFPVYAYTHYNQVMIDYYLTRVRQLPFVEAARTEVAPLGEGGVGLTVYVTFSSSPGPDKKGKDLFRDPGSFPVIYSNKNTFLTFRLSASEMAYSNNNAWFGRPDPLLKGNPLVDGPAGGGYTGWIEGFVAGGIYGVVPVWPAANLHVYGGANYIVSFSAGRELFTDRSRFYGHADDAFVGLTGGGRIGGKREYGYNLLYGRKQYILGNGWLIVNTAMNGEERGALQLNPRRAARRLFQAGIRIDRWVLQAFRLEPNELRILDSRTVLQGINLEWNDNDRIQAGASWFYSPRSKVTYYLPDGSTHDRKGLRVYNIRLFGNPALNRAGFFYKTEFGYQTNRYFPMKAYAWYVRLGWNFAGVAGKPALSYRYAYFSGDDPDTEAYERWDPLYTGGNGEQWVQGSNMYKIVQNSNEATHLIQLVYTPVPRWQTVAQLWFFRAPDTNNLGGNPGLSLLKAHRYGAELNLTVKYFRSRNWYFHLNTALTFPGPAVRDLVTGARNWFSLMGFVQYSF